jgi:hypothetical protein
VPSGFPHRSGFPSGLPSGFAHHSGHGQGPTVRPSGSGAPPSMPSPMKRQESGAPPAFSGMPTVRPTGVPSGFPSGFPAGIPSGFPSEIPSGFPSGIPSGFPSGIPSGAPHHSGFAMESGHSHGPRPTDFPSGLGALHHAPSGAPVKRQESGAPPAFSGMPTVRPTGVPSGIPSGFPSGVPSGFPSGMPFGAHGHGPRPTGARPTGAHPTGARPTGFPFGAAHHSGFAKGSGHSRGPRPTNLPSGFGQLHHAPSGAPSAIKPSGFVTMRRA